MQWFHFVTSSVEIKKLKQANERIPKTNRRSMKYRSPDNEIVLTFVTLSFLSMSVMRQI